jgi:hypothetical protein
MWAVTKIVCGVVCVLWLVSGTRAVAQTNDTAFRATVIDPIITEESMPEANGECNLRMITAYHADALDPPVALPRAQLFCGLSRRWGGEVDIPMILGEAVGARYGLGDVAIAVKYVLREQTTLIPALVIGLETAFPSGNPVWDRGENGVEIEPFLAFLKQARGFTFQGNVGFGIRHNREAREYRTSFNGATGFPVRHTRWALMGEINGALGPEHTVFALSPGVHYSLGPDVFVGVAMPITAYGAPLRVGLILQFQMHVLGGS